VKVTTVSVWLNKQSAVLESPVPDEAQRFWINLPRSTQENSKIFSGSWTLQPSASGIEPVRQILADMSDIYRVCKRFGLKFEEAETPWPLLYVEFQLFRDEPRVNFEVSRSSVANMGLI
jgi:hypothetical protein